MANLSIKVLENNFTDEILDEYMKLVLDNGPSYHWYYTKTKTFSDNFFFVIGQKNFVDKVCSGNIPVSFEFFKLLCRDFHRFGYDYSHLRKIKPRTNEDSFKFFENFPKKTIENIHMIKHIDKEKLLNLLSERDALGSIEPEIIDLAFYSYSIDFEYLKELMKKYSYIPNYSGLFHQCAYNWINDTELGKNETYNSIKEKAEILKDKFIENGLIDNLKVLFNVSDRKRSLFPGYSSFESDYPMININYDFKKFWYIENPNGGKTREQYDYASRSTISDYYYDTQQDYKYDPIYPFLSLDNQKKFIDDFFLAIDTTNFNKEANERASDINRHLKMFYAKARNKKDIKKYLVSKLFEGSLEQNIVISLFKEDDFLLFLFVADRDTIDYMKKTNLEFLQLLFLKFKKTYYFFCKLYKTDPLAKKRKAEEFCYGNIYEDKCMTCVHYPEKNLSGISQCKMNYENALEIELIPLDSGRSYNYYRKVSTFKEEK